MSATMIPRAAIELHGLTRTFGTTTAVDHIDLSIAEGEFFSMLGPSGSGKTTVLRLIAGFEQPTSGRISLFGEDVTDVAPFDRDVNTVFQDYALFPHMSVLDNVAYGLRVRGMAKSARHARAREALDTVRLADFADRKPSQLSGGQRQRVALARATVVEPKVLLLDEPLGALDLKLREQLQVELKQLQRTLGITFIFVTHDQEEALTLSDRIAVFNAGRIEQLGTPAEIYEAPTSRFVAGFVGTSNIFDGEISQRLIGRPGIRSIRPERISLATAPGPSSPGQSSPGSVSAAGAIAEVIYVGTSSRVLVDLDAGARISVLARGDEDHFGAHDRGARVTATWRLADMVDLEDPSPEPVISHA